MCTFVICTCWKVFHLLWPWEDSLLRFTKVIGHLLFKKSWESYQLKCKKVSSLSQKPFVTLAPTQKSFLKWYSQGMDRVWVVLLPSTFRLQPADLDDSSEHSQFPSFINFFFFFIITTLKYYEVSSSHILRQCQHSLSPYLSQSDINIPSTSATHPQVSIHYLDGVQTANSIRGSEHCSCTQTLQFSHEGKD